jgi:WD40 repeat protein
MQHTYLRYECADAFGLVSASASSKIPHSNSTLAFASSSRSQPIILTSAGSHCAGFHLRTTNPTIKIAHPEENTGGVGTGRALNSSQIVCIDVARHIGNGDCRVATGWVDGAVRVFNVTSDELNSEEGLVQTFLAEKDDDYISREPLVLNGHSGSPIRSISFDSGNSTRLASGSSDGAVVLWDVVEECGLFRLLGHRGAITEIHFASLERGSFDCLITSSLDGLVKVWDLKGQCCVQTIASHRGKVWASTCMVASSGSAFPSEDGDISSFESERARLVTGDDDGYAKVWSITAPRRHKSPLQARNANDEPIAFVEDSSDEGSSDCCLYMGSLKLPSTMPPATDHVAGIRFHPDGKYVGVLHANSRSVHVYVLRGPQETQRRKQRRVSRHRQKAKQTQDGLASGSEIKNRKRGILDDAETPETPVAEALVADVTVEKIIASDEFEFVGSVNASHKVRSFVFVPWKESGSTLRVVCSLVTNALEVLSLQRSSKR